jgi:hypothetical protein
MYEIFEEITNIPTNIPPFLASYGIQIKLTQDTCPSMMSATTNSSINY